jgi:hypothetical protein
MPCHAHRYDLDSGLGLDRLDGIHDIHPEKFMLNTGADRPTHHLWMSMVRADADADADAYANGHADGVLHLTQFE